MARSDWLPFFPKIFKENVHIKAYSERRRKDNNFLENVRRIELSGADNESSLFYSELREKMFFFAIFKIIVSLLYNLNVLAIFVFLFDFKIDAKKTKM